MDIIIGHYSPEFLLCGMTQNETKLTYHTLDTSTKNERQNAFWPQVKSMKGPVRES
jgi:hypothetical protein